ncbi:innexin shaking-B-like [Clytia hemisphaerica]|uniref:Innexin n=1 Tax=Clytia hemisphaerica TaxID=252671 RepID=A0A7M5V447_9CNID
MWGIIWKSKTQYDSRSDQYTRSFMPKFLIVLSIMMGYTHLNDKINCMLTSRVAQLKQFVEETCWIKGFYIYNEMHARLNESAYYGIPEYTGYDGVMKSGERHLCSTIGRAGGNNEECTPMTKRYITQYQWLPLYILVLAVLYYLPYVVYKAVNTDMIALVNSVDGANNKDVEKIANNYFNYQINSKLKMRIIVWANVAVKVLFILTNITGFLLTDKMMDGKFRTYGTDSMAHNTNLPNRNSTDFSYIDQYVIARPGDYLLPTVGICEFHEALTDKRGIYIDKHKVICEISENRRYQIYFIILWLFMFSGILISSFGLLLTVLKLVKSLLWVHLSSYFGENPLSNKFTTQLTLRELQYLDKMEDMDLTMYGELLRELSQNKSKTFSAADGTSEMVTLLPAGT